MIQNPELLRALQTSLGLRQMHTAPTLNEGVQPVVVIADLAQALTSPVVNGKAYLEMAGGAQFFTARIQNPVTTRKRLRIQRLRLGQVAGAATIRMSLALGSIVGFTTDWGAPAAFAVGYDESTIGQSSATLLPRRVAGVSSAGVNVGYQTNAALSNEVNVATLDRFALAAAPTIVLIEDLQGIVVDPGFAFGWQNLAAPSIGALAGMIEWTEEELTS